MAADDQMMYPRARFGSAAPGLQCQLNMRVRPIIRDLLDLYRIEKRGLSLPQAIESLLQQAGYTPEYLEENRSKLEAFRNFSTNGW